MERTDPTRRPQGQRPSAVEHTETHGGRGATLRDLVLGMSDGLTVPFALAAGVSGAVASTGIVLTAGIAEVVAGSISMGLGGYLATRTEAEHYQSEYQREIRETEEIPAEERAEVATILHGYGLREPLLTQAVDAIARDQRGWVEFMMRNELGLERPQEGGARKSALTIGGAYAVGGIVPLIPYAFLPDVGHALAASCVVGSISLLIFGWFKAGVTETPRLAGAVQSLIVGGIAAGVAFLLARLISGHTFVV